MVSKKVKLREEFLKQKERYRKGSLSKSDYIELKNTYEKQKTDIENRQLYELATAPKEKVVGSNIQEAARQTLIQRQTPVSQPSKEITQVSNQYGQTYKGKVVKDSFIGVRPVSKREQQLKASTKAGFYSVLTPNLLQNQKSKAKVITEQTAIRGSLGIYTPTPLTSDVKYSFTKSEPVPKETGYKAFVSKGESVYKEFTFRNRKGEGIQFLAAAIPIKFAKGVIGGAGDLVTQPKEFTKSTIKLAFFPLYPKYTIQTFKETGKQIITNPIETVGRFTGQAIVFKGVGAIGKLGKAGYTRVTSEYQFKFKPADKGAYLNYNYYNLEGSGQRNLFGKNLGKTPSPAGNINKVGFGIEKNTLLGSRNTILPSGQTKLAQNEIIAFNKVSGKFSNVKITPNKDVFVYNPDVKKFTEISPEYQLITRNPRYTYDLVGAKKIYTKTPQVQTFDVSNQVKLSDFGFKNPVRASSPIYTPKAKSSFQPSTETPRVFSQGNSVTTFRPKFDNMQVFSKSQYTYPNYDVSMEVQTPSPPIVKAKSGLGLSNLAGLGFSQGLRVNQAPKQSQFSLSGTAFKTSNLAVQKQSPVYSLGFKQNLKDIQLPKAAQSYKLSQKQAPVQVQAQKQESSFAAIQTPTQSFTGLGLSQKTTFRTPKTPSFSNYFPKSRNKPNKSLFGKGLSVSQPKAYLPSLRASFFGLKGKKKDKDMFTGLEERLL